MSRNKNLLHVLTFLAVSVAGGGCDLTTKALAERSLEGVPGRTMSVIEPWLDLSLSYNQGTAFSMIGDLGSTRLVLGILSFVIVAGLLAMMVFSRELVRLEVIALATIAGGAFGNGYDRVFRLAPDGDTGVVDFIKVNYPWGGSWPTFNVADVLLVVGVGLFVLARLLPLWRTKRGDPAAS